MRRSGFSLASLFVLIAVAAVMAGVIQTEIRQDRHQSGLAIFMMAFVGPLVGLVVGIAMGVRRQDSMWGLAAGALTGLVSGVLAGILMVVPEGLWTVVGGSVVIVVFCLFARRLSRRAAEP